MAKNADIHELYEEAVQSVDNEVEFIESTFLALRNRSAKTFREDFCGTASLCCAWVRGSSDRYAIGVDIDQKVLQEYRMIQLLLHPLQDQQVLVCLLLNVQLF